MDSPFVGELTAPLIASICGGICWITAIYFKYLKKRKSTHNQKDSVKGTGDGLYDFLGDMLLTTVIKSTIIFSGVCILATGFYIKIKGYYTSEVGLYCVFSLLLLLCLWLYANEKETKRNKS